MRARSTEERLRGHYGSARSFVNQWHGNIYNLRGGEFEAWPEHGGSPNDEFGLPHLIDPRICDTCSRAVFQTSNATAHRPVNQAMRDSAPDFEFKPTDPCESSATTSQITPYMIERFPGGASGDAAKRAAGRVLKGPCEYRAVVLPNGNWSRCLAVDENGQHVPIKTEEVSVRPFFVVQGEGTKCVQSEIQAKCTIESPLGGGSWAINYHGPGGGYDYPGGDFRPQKGIYHGPHSRQDTPYGWVNGYYQPNVNELVSGVELEKVLNREVAPGVDPAYYTRILCYRGDARRMPALAWKHGRCPLSVGPTVGRAAVIGR